MSDDRRLAVIDAIGLGGGVVSIDQVRAVETLIAAERIKTEKAYGGCHNCYGKGYATVNDRWFGNDTDQDIGSPGGTISGGNHNAMKLCACDRGKQLGRQLKMLNNEAKL